MTKKVDWTSIDSIIQNKSLIMPFTEVAKLVSLSEITVRRRAKFLGLESLVSNKMRLNRENLKIDFFRTWSPQMAYTLGYIYADGSLEVTSCGTYSLGLGCSTEDEIIILQIREWLGSQHKITREPEKLNAHGLRRDPFTRCSISSKVLIQSLIEIGPVPNKSNLDLPFPVISSEFKPHFMRGYLDGDGGVYHRITDTQVQRYLYFKGTFNFIKGLQESLIYDLGIAKNKLFVEEESPTCYKASWGSKEDLRKLYDYLYPDQSVFCLPRKRSKLELCVQGI